jgi:hypothetical protein
LNFLVIEDIEVNFLLLFFFLIPIFFAFDLLFSNYEEVLLAFNRIIQTLLDLPFYLDERLFRRNNGVSFLKDVSVDFSINKNNASSRLGLRF